MKQQAAELHIFLFESQSAFEGWLNANATTAPGVWLQLAKKNSGIASISYELCCVCPSRTRGKAVEDFARVSA